ncbi:hypothetical protein [Pseudohalioglobus lutimaris]|uniref:Uncharacterized protein n=1 Tax=Pseudohalioglobus lutimaris TaxID=1737061 RepID=A0A2N5WY18_9GAMM|nr:hypothetical protein [Pseudohalioglobus lutimaris]PLW67133.1 hypothetical protein C0039_18645 [Pseudohalioglobus lutimaris]
MTVNIIGHVAWLMINHRSDAPEWMPVLAQAWELDCVEPQAASEDSLGEYLKRLRVESRLDDALLPYMVAAYPNAALPDASAKWLASITPLIFTIGCDHLVKGGSNWRVREAARRTRLAATRKYDWAKGSVGGLSSKQIMENLDGMGVFRILCHSNSSLII